MARKKSTRQTRGMTAYPPLDVAPALGAYKSTEFNQALRILAHMLGTVAEAVESRFTAAEWGMLYDLLAAREIEPENPSPGPLLAQLFDHAKYRLGPEATEEGSTSLSERLRTLTYIEAWSVLIAIKFRRERLDTLPKGCEWWTLALRWRVLSPELELDHPDVDTPPPKR